MSEPHDMSRMVTIPEDEPLKILRVDEEQKRCLVEWSDEQGPRRAWVAMEYLEHLKN